MEDPHELQRFVDAQDAGDTFRTALAELGQGRKRSHWMWFVFPQVAGLGRSEAARYFAVSGRAEALAYLAHPVLGPRLSSCAELLTGLQELDAVRVFGEVDAMKLQSSMTLFTTVAPQDPLFRDVLEGYFDGVLDEQTISRL